MPDKRPVILIAYANDRSDAARYLRDLVGEVRGIRRVLYDAVVPPCLIELLPNATLDDLVESLDRHEGQVQVLHYAGHADSLGLMFEREDGAAAPVGQTGLVRLLGRHAPSLRLVFLNGCATAAHAHALVDAGIAAVIATDRHIGDRAATLFATHLYARLAAGRSLRRAYQDAEIYVQSSLGYGGDHRSLYWADATPAPEDRAFPWGLYGEGLGWLLPGTRRRGGNARTVLLCDRDRQVQVLRQHIEDRLQQDTWPPQFFVLHGRQEDRHRSLVERCREVEIRQIAEQHFGHERGRIDYFETREWPATGDLALRQRDLRRQLLQTTGVQGLPGSDWSAQALFAGVSSRAGVVLIQHTLFAARWDAQSEALLRWYIDVFWQMTSARDRQPLFVIFLNLIFEPDDPGFWQRFWGGPNRRQRLLKRLHQLQSSRQERMQILRELHPVSRTDVAEWVETHYPDELEGLADVVFQDPRRRLSMAAVEHQLREAVMRLLHARDQRARLEE
ncbi:MAG: hypothetical protein OHK0039_15700 [Bacteroidia bacterium]